MRFTTIVNVQTQNPPQLDDIHLTVERPPTDFDLSPMAPIIKTASEGNVPVRAASGRARPPRIEGLNDAPDSELDLVRCWFRAPMWYYDL